MISSLNSADWRLRERPTEALDALRSHLTHHYGIVAEPWGAGAAPGRQREVALMAAQPSTPANKRKRMVVRYLFYMERLTEILTVSLRFVVIPLREGFRPSAQGKMYNGERGSVPHAVLRRAGRLHVGRTGAVSLCALQPSQKKSEPVHHDELSPRYERRIAATPWSQSL